MFKVQKSRLFIRQLERYARDYKNRAGVEIARKFVLEVGEVLKFIAHNPYACMEYDAGDDDLQKYQFRKWNVQGFPHFVLFRVVDDNIILEVIYSHRMDIYSRLSFDVLH